MTELLKIYSPKNEKANILVNIDSKIKRLSPSILNARTDRELVNIILEGFKYIRQDQYSYKTPLSQIFKRNNVNLNCERHKKIFDTKNIIPEFCFGCFKVQVEVSTVIELIKLTSLFYKFDFKQNLSRKTFIELRPNISGSYKGLIYCKGLDQAHAVKYLLDIDLKGIFSGKIESEIKRGCSEYPLKVPDYGRIPKNPIDLMNFPQEWKLIEDQFDQNYVKDSVKKSPSLSEFCLSDFYIIQKWVDYARGIGDQSAEVFNESPTRFVDIFEAAKNRKGSFSRANSPGAQGKSFDPKTIQLSKVEKVVESDQINLATLEKALGSKMERREFEQAIILAEQMTKMDPNDEKIFATLGSCHQQLKNYDQAIEFYTKALALKPDFAQVYNNMGATFKDQGKSEEAIGAYAKALLIKPDYSDAYGNMGNVFKDQGKFKDAVDAYEKSLSFNPKNAANYNNMGLCLRGQGELEEAIVSFKRAIALKSDYAGAHSNLGVALQERGQLEEAVEAYSEALSINPNFADAYNNMGNILQELGKVQEAIGAYNKAVILKPNFADAYNNLGNALKAQGKRATAIEAFNKAISIKPDYAEAHRNLSTVKKYTTQDKQFRQVQELFKRDDLSADSRCQLSFALAKMYEDIGSLDQAFSHLCKGNLLRTNLLKYSINQDKELFTKLENAQPYLAKISPKIKKSAITPTPIFILGMPRSGTTLIQQIISSHSDVHGAGELSFISQFGGYLALDTATINTAAILQFRERYLLELSKQSNGEPFVTDKMPQNFCFIPLICAAFPEAKIIHVKRSAAAICWSNYKNFFSKGLGYSYSLQDVVHYYRLYANLVDLWQSKYGNRIYHLHYEHLITAQENETNRLIEYLELPWEEACLFPHRNKGSVRTTSHQQVRQKVYSGSSEDWRKYEPFLNGAFDSLPK
ncbi:tetratricopeptide repeat protein [bacterium]|nr:tetratricopeptide repeat protein [bacterium]